MSEEADKDQKTESPTPKRLKEAAEKGDVLQSRELSTALVVVGGALWIAFAGPLMIGALETMMKEALTFDAGAIRNFNPAGAILRLAAIVAPPLIILFAITLLAAIGTPAMLGSLGFRSKAFSFKASKLNPLSGLKRIFGIQGLIELGKSIAKVLLLGAVGVWLLFDQADALIGLAAQDVRAALGEIGGTFTLAVLIMAFALAIIALIDVPAQMFQRSGRLRMTKQQVKDEHKQTEGSPEVKSAIRRRQHEVLRASARSAVQEATVVLTNPTHFAVALRYRPGIDPAPFVVAKGKGEMAAAIRELAAEAKVPMLSYPQLTRALYFTARTGQIIREDLYLAVASILAFVFNLDAAMASGTPQPAVDVPTNARFDEKGRPQP